MQRAFHDRAIEGALPKRSPGVGTAVVDRGNAVAHAKHRDSQFLRDLYGGGGSVRDPQQIYGNDGDVPYSESVRRIGFGRSRGFIA